MARTAIQSLSLLFTLTLAFCIVSGAAAQPVTVATSLGATGQGLLVRQGGACWLLTAAHLMADDGAFEVRLEGQPPVTGDGEAAQPFWEGLDLAIGFVRGGAGEACTLRLDEIARGTVSLSGTTRYRLAYVARSGAASYPGMRLTDVPDHKTFSADFSRDARAFQGRSGAFLLDGERPVGMAYLADGENGHRFIRIEEITMNARRWLAERGDAFRGTAAPEPVPQPAGYELVVVESTLAPAEIGQDVSDVLEDGRPFLFRGNGRIVLRVADGSLQKLRGLRILSDGEEAVPRGISVDIDRRFEGPLDYNWFASGPMDPAGEFDTGLRAEREMRRIVISISSAWGEGPRRIDRIEVY